ncbi:MAG: HEAT repeat domain-containing protein [Candidatus Aminicenantes bacterium]|nr:MAG: HEAT repeat domain-containing protein [Candidatus Aminicenantes bacterium]
MKKYTVIIFCFLLFFNLSAGPIPTAAELLEKLEKCDLPECRVAVEWCGLLKVREAVPILENLLEKKDSRYWRLKIEIVKALGKIGDLNSIGVLLSHLPNPYAVSALNQIDPNWRYRIETEKYHAQQLDKFYRNDSNKCRDREETFEVLLVIDDDEQRMKGLCLDVLEQKDGDLMSDAVDKLVELNAYEAIDPLLDILEEPPRHYIYRYVNALDALSPGWRESERGRAMGERIIREFKKRKAEFDRHIIDPEYAKLYDEYKELQSSGNNNKSHPQLEFNAYKGSREITAALEMIQQVQLPSGIPLLLQIFQDEQELLSLRCQVAEALGEIIEAGDTKTLRILIKNLNHKQAEVRFASVQALKRFGERYPDTVVQLYNEAKESVRDSYIKILGRLKDPRALPILQKALKDKNRSVRAYAEWGIYHITKE